MSEPEITFRQLLWYVGQKSRTVEKSCFGFSLLFPSDSHLRLQECPYFKRREYGEAFAGRKTRLFEREKC